MDEKEASVAKVRKTEFYTALTYRTYLPNKVIMEGTGDCDLDSSA
jgi:hypothetical protein